MTKILDDSRAVMATAEYISMGVLPAGRVAAGYVLAHNGIMHTATTRCGVNGFRAWTWPKDKVPEHFKPCGCGWSGLPHYSSAEFQRKLRTAA